MPKNRLELIRKLRRENNYSQEYVANKLGISQKAYSEIENGKTNLKHEQVNLLAELLHISADEICNISNCCTKEIKNQKLFLIKLLEENKIPIPLNLL